jgi:hypothetical protein
MMLVDSNIGGQVIVPDENYFYILNRSGFSIYSRFPEEFKFFVQFNPAVRSNQGEKAVWKHIGWSETHLFFCSSFNMFKILRNSLDFPLIKKGTWSGDEEIREVSAMAWRGKFDGPSLPISEGFLPGTIEEKLKNHFYPPDECFRIRKLLKSNSRYARKDSWLNNNAHVIDKESTDKEEINYFRKVIEINGTRMEIGESPANDVSFSIDGLTLFVLTQSCKTLMIDVE